jgi:VWA domain containing CoxE-like protein
VLTEPDEPGPDEAGPDEAGPDESERLRRWRLLLGSPAEAELGGGGLSAGDADLDGALAALYDGDGDGDGGSGARSPGRGSGLGASAPRVARWLGDIRQYFPSTVVQVMQRDAIDRLNLRQLLLEQEMLENLEPDVHLVGTLLSLQAIMPETTKATARLVVAKVVAEIERRIAARTRRPKPRDIDWNKTIAANLARYVPSHHTVIPERLVGYGRRQQAVARDIVLAIDQSGSMASSVVYASVFGAVLASLRSVRTSVVAFDTSVADLSPLLADPVDVLFGAQLGGGTDINQAVAYCEGLITRPRDTILVLISDLYEGGDAPAMLARLGALRAAGVCVVALLALSDDGAPSYDASHAAALAALGVPAFACTPDAFPGLLAVAIEGGDVGAWAQQEELASRHAARLPRPGCCAGRGAWRALGRPQRGAA